MFFTKYTLVTSVQKGQNIIKSNPLFVLLFNEADTRTVYSSLLCCGSNFSWLKMFKPVLF